MTRNANHALVRFEEGSLLLDLRSGGLFQLNQSATFVWERWLAKLTAPEIAAALAETYSLPPKTAEEHVAVALASKTIAPPPPTEFVYERAANRYLFSRGDESILAIDERDSSIALAGPRIDKADLRNVLLSVAPKLLALRGHYVVHASAVILDGEVSAFCGESGAGKTTTARTLVRAGATLVCEDKLVVRTRGERVEAVSGIETELLRWSQAAAESLANGTGAFCPDLDRVKTERPLVLREIGLIGAARRAGERIVALPLTPLAGAGGIFRNAFYGSDVSGDWERQLRRAAEIAHRVVTYDLTMPAGTAPLAAAAAEVVRRGSLRS